MPLRLDRSAYRKPVKLKNGYLRADGTLTTVGVFKYRKADGTTRRELRLPEEVFHPDSLASFSMMPVTDEHPPVALDAENTHEFQVGAVGETPHRDGDHVAATVLVTNAKTVAKVERGDARELSCGYNCRLDQTPGVWNGEPYDAIQRDIRGNHVALVAKGRAGPEVRIRMDAEDAVLADAEESDKTLNDDEALTTDEAPEGQEQDMRIQINGVWLEVPEQAAQALEVERSRNDEALKAATAKAEKEAARADGLKERLDKAETERKDAADPKRLQAAVAARVALEKDASEVLGTEVRLDSLTDEQVKADVLKKLCPTLKLDGKSADYVQGRYEQALEAFRADGADDALGAVRRAAVGGTPGTRRDAEDDVDLSAEEASAKWAAESRNAWKQLGKRSA